MHTPLIHPIPPVYDAHSRVLLLGTFPSPYSRETGFYYGHPQNRFWRVLSDILRESCPNTIEEKKALLLRRHIALWDVLHSCVIQGASDASIRKPVPNDITSLLREADIRAIFATGAKANALYQRYCEPQTGIACRRLPSTSAANCQVSYAALCAAYAEITVYL